MENLTTDTKKILLLDMDEVLVDFHSHPTLRVPRDSYNHENIYKRGYFGQLKPLSAAVESVKELLACGKYNIYICTQPLAGSPYSYSEKAEWIAEYLPELEGKIIMTCDKSMVRGDILIDDNLKWADFGGEFIYFNHSEPDFHPLDKWVEIVEYLL